MISILLPNLCGGGAERISLDLAREFRASGHDVAFLLMSAHGEFLEEAQREFSIVDLQAPRVRQLPLKLIRYLRASPPDALLAAMWPLTVIAPFAAKVAGFRGKLLVSEHNALSVQYAPRGRTHRLAMQASMRLGYPLADVRVGVSQGVCEDMAALSGLAAVQMTVIHNPVRQLASADADKRRAAEAIWNGAMQRVLTVGSLKDQKNHVMLLRAFADLPLQEATLMLLGVGANEAKLRHLVQELGLGNRVIFAGFHRDPTPFYETADLFVLSSDHEGLPTVLIEALSCGLPVVSTDCPSGPAEILENGRYGRLTPVGDAAALARAMAEALQETPDRDALKRRAADFAPEKAARAYLEAMGLA